MRLAYLLKAFFDQRLAAGVMSVKKKERTVGALALWSSSSVGQRDRKLNAMSDFMPTSLKRWAAKGKYCLRVEISLSSVLVAKSSQQSAAMPAVLFEFAFCSRLWLIGAKSLRVSSQELFKQLAIDRIIFGPT